MHDLRPHHHGSQNVVYPTRKRYPPRSPPHGPFRSRPNHPTTGPRPGPRLRRPRRLGLPPRQGSHLHHRPRRPRQNSRRQIHRPALHPGAKPTHRLLLRLPHRLRRGPPPTPTCAKLRRSSASSTCRPAGSPPSAASSLPSTARAPSPASRSASRGDKIAHRNGYASSATLKPPGPPISNTTITAAASSSSATARAPALSSSL